MTAARRRLQSPTGAVMWRVTGQGIEPTIHDTQQQATNRAALHKGALVYPIIVELEEPETA